MGPGGGGGGGCQRPPPPGGLPAPLWRAVWRCWGCEADGPPFMWWSPICCARRSGDRGRVLWSTVQTHTRCGCECRVPSRRVARAALGTTAAFAPAVADAHRQRLRPWPRPCPLAHAGPIARPSAPPDPPMPPHREAPLRPCAPGPRSAPLHFAPERPRGRVPGGARRREALVWSALAARGRALSCRGPPSATARGPVQPPPTAQPTSVTVPLSFAITAAWVRGCLKVLAVLTFGAAPRPAPAAASGKS